MMMNRSVIRCVRASTPKILRNNFTKISIRQYAEVSNGLGIDNNAVETNKKTETNRLEKTLSKFWEKVAIRETSNGFLIELDSKNIKTPLGNPLMIPKTKKTLAYLVETEWKNLQNLQIKPFVVPLTSVVSRAIDLESSDLSKDEEAIAKIGDLSNIREMLLKYLDTDTLLVFSPVLEYEGTLRQAQEDIYRPIIKSMEEFFQPYAQKGEIVKLTYLDSDKHGLVGNLQTKTTRDAVKKWLESLDTWDLVALEKATLTAKSFLSGVLILRSQDPNDKDRLSLEEIAKAATLETIYQTERWGEVEDTHDVDKVDIRRNLATCALIAYDDKKF